jgi:hypothetical protein
MKAFALFIFALYTITGYSQNTINSYKYVIVPERFSFSKENDQYGLNGTTKWMLMSKGFVVFMANEDLPQAVAANKCSVLRAEVVERKTFLSTNLTLFLKDCQGDTIFRSKEGKSREKEWQTAYNEALKDAFASLDAVPYKYDSTLSATPAATVTPTPTTTSSAPVLAPSPAPPTSPTPTTTSPTPTPASSPAPPAPPVGTPAPPASPVPPVITGTLYAQVIPNGYQLVDTTPKKVLTLLKTSVADYFIAETGYSGGIVFKKDGAWFFEYYKDDKLVSQQLQIRF